MLILVGLLFLLTIGLAVFALLPSKKQEPEEPAEKIIRPGAAILEPLNPAVGRIEELVQEKLRLQAECEQLKKENLDLKVKSLSGTKEAEEARQQLAELKAKPPVNDELSRKTDGLIKENSDLANEIRLLETQIISYKKESAQTVEALNKNKILETQIEDYKNEIAKLNQALAQKPQEAQPAAPDVVSELTNKIRLLEAQIESYKKESAQAAEALDKIKSLEAQIEDYKKQASQPAAGETVPKEEYEELKKKLEAAESVLKIVHGEMDGQ